MKKLLGLAVLVLLTIASCTKDAEPGTVTLNFNHEVSSQSLFLDSMMYTSSAGHTFSIVNLNYYVSNFSLHNTDGKSHDTKTVHYRDASDDATTSLILDKVPVGTYNKISFIYGLDAATNVNDGLDNTVTNQNMEWPIPGDQGYHYMKYEGRYDSLAMGIIKSYNLHTGGTMGNQNFVEITVDLPSNIEIDNSSWNVNMVMDLNEWLQNPAIYDFAQFGQLIMMNQNAQEVLKGNGVNVYTCESVTKK